MFVGERERNGSSDGRFLSVGRGVSRLAGDRDQRLPGSYGLAGVDTYPTTGKKWGRTPRRARGREDPARPGHTRPDAPLAFGTAEHFEEARLSVASGGREERRQDRGAACPGGALVSGSALIAIVDIRLRITSIRTRRPHACSSTSAEVEVSEAIAAALRAVARVVLACEVSELRARSSRVGSAGRRLAERLAAAYRRVGGAAGNECHRVGANDRGDGDTVFYASRGAERDDRPHGGAERDNYDALDGARSRHGTLAAKSPLPAAVNVKPASTTGRTRHGTKTSGSCAPSSMK